MPLRLADAAAFHQARRYKQVAAPGAVQGQGAHAQPQQRQRRHQRGAEDRKSRDGKNLRQPQGRERTDAQRECVTHQPGLNGRPSRR
jgi:hypothetical protein